MKHLFLFLTLIFTIFSARAEWIVTVKNSLNFERRLATVSVPLAELRKSLSADDIKSLVVYNGDKQLPVQISGDLLLFQATVGANSTQQYSIKIGKRENYIREAYGRLVPERKDDWAWENNRIAFRVYGPALEATGEVSNGIDVWVKSTPDLIINQWYKSGDYHTDNGQGLDYYKVGRTLGAGAMAPISGEQLWFGNNFVDAKLMDDGPIRTTVLLNYAPYMVNGKEVQEKRIISLDANTNFNTITEIYEGDFDSLPVAAGIILRKSGHRKAFSQAIAYSEPQDARNGTTHIAVIMTEKAAIDTIANHLVLKTAVHNRKPYTYYNGAGWSKALHPDPESWQQSVQQQIECINTPLTFTLKSVK